MKRECAIKRMRKEEKEKLAAGWGQAQPDHAVQ